MNPKIFRSWQYYLDLLLSLPLELRYNFLPNAGSSLGYYPSDATRAKISESHRGKSFSDVTCANISKSQKCVDRTGSNNPSFGKIAVNAIKINVYFATDITLVYSFSSKTTAAKELNIHRTTLDNYIRSGKVLKGKYIIHNSDKD